MVIRAPDGQSVRRIRNVQNELHAKDPARYPRDARIAYFMEPKELEQALREADSPGHGLHAFYHSHPDHDAYFSAEDEAAAMPFGEPSYPEAIYVVISVRSGKVAGRIAVAWDEQKRAYAEVDLVTSDR